MRTALSCTLIVLSLTACARDVRVAYPARGEAATGTVVVLLTRAAPDLTVAVNGALVASGKHARRVAVTGVPAGAAEVDVAFGGGALARAEHHVRVDVVAGDETTVVLPGPEESTAFAIEQGALVLGEMICLGLMYVAVF